MRIRAEHDISLDGVFRSLFEKKLSCSDSKQLSIGIAVELEHTSDIKEAEKIARDHLAENPDYYTDPMKKNWGIDEAQDRVSEIAKKASINNECPVCGSPKEGGCRCRGPHTFEDLKKGHGSCCKNGHRWSGDTFWIPSEKTTTASNKTAQKLFEETSEDPWQWEHQTNRDLSTGTIAGIVDQIDFRLGRPKDPPSEETVRERAWGYAVYFIEKMQNKDFGEKDNRARIAMIDSITKAFFDEMAVRRGWNVQLNLMGVPPWESNDYPVKQASELKDCQRCKGKGGYFTTLRNPGTGDRSQHYVICDMPGCHNGKYDPSTLCQECHDPDGREKPLHEISRKAITNDKIIRQATIFVLEDDPERIAIFQSAFGKSNVFVTRNVKEAVETLRTYSFSKIFLDRDLSHPKETGEDVAWQMEREAMCKNTPIVIHSENTRGQRVMSRYLSRYHLIFLFEN